MKANTMLHTVGCALAAASMLGAGLPLAKAQQKPNIVFMVIDNLGYGELRIYGGVIVRCAPTSRIESMTRPVGQIAWKLELPGEQKRAG